MSTQKAKFELFSRLEKLGFSYEEARQLRRIEMTLHRWAEQECGDSNDYASWAIERDEATNRPYKVTYPHNGKSTRYPIADREAGALKRLKSIMASHPDFVAYHQTDPRGCALYIVRRADLPKLSDAEIVRMHGASAINSTASRLGAVLSQYYTRGLAVCA